MENFPLGSGVLKYWYEHEQTSTRVLKRSSPDKDNPHLNRIAEANASADTYCFCLGV